MAEDVFSIAAENGELLRAARSSETGFSTLDHQWDYTREGIMHQKIDHAGLRRGIVVVSTHIAKVNENNRRTKKAVKHE